MHYLVCRHGTARIAPHAPYALLPIRFNEIGARNTHSDSKLSHRLAMSWGDITIPSQGDILRNPHAKNMEPNADQTKSYKPDLRYLSEGTATSLASRLAHKLEKPQIATSSDTPDMSGTKERPVDHTIAQRRAARLAREQARRQPSEGQRASFRELPVDSQRRSAHLRLQFNGAGQLGPRQDGRDRARSPRPNSGHGGQRFQHGSLISSGIAGARWSAGGSSSRGSRDGAAKRKAVQGGPPYRIHAVRAGEEMSNSEDISLEILEEGGDEKEQAEFKGPDTTFADLDEVFGRLALRSHSVSPRTEAPVADLKWVKETSSGDYARFAPYSSRDFLVSHYKISPVKHVQLVLSKRGDVSITARHRALHIVESSVSGAGTISARRV